MKWLLPLAALCFLMSLCLVTASYAEDKPVPKVELVKPPDGLTGKYATNPGVKEFFGLIALETEGKLDEAKKAYTEFITRFKDQPVAILYLANIYLKQGDKEKATELIQLADKTNPG